MNKADFVSYPHGALIISYINRQVVAEHYQEKIVGSNRDKEAEFLPGVIGEVTCFI